MKSFAAILFSFVTGFCGGNIRDYHACACLCCTAVPYSKESHVYSSITLKVQYGQQMQNNTTSALHMCHVTSAAYLHMLAVAMRRSCRWSSSRISITVVCLPEPAAYRRAGDNLSGNLSIMELP